MKRYLELLVIGEVQIKTEISPHNSQNGFYEKETSIGEDVEKWNPHELFVGI